MADRSEETSTTTTEHYDVERRPRRWLALLAAIPLVAGVIETNDRIEDDLEGRALAAGALSVDFSAQDGEVCAPSDVVDEIRDITGVVKLAVEDGCDAAAVAAPATTAAPTPPGSPATTAAPAAEPTDIVDALAAADEFTTLLDLAGAAGVDEVLRGEGPLTLFAPTDDAFAAVDPAVLDALGADTDLLAQVLSHHALEGAVASADLVTGTITPLGGEDLDVEVDGGVFLDADGADRAQVTLPDQTATNGIIHTIDRVLIPPSLRATAPSAVDVIVEFDGTAYRLTGTVDTDDQRERLVAAAIAAAGGDESLVVDELVFAGAGEGPGDEVIDRLAGLLGAWPGVATTATATADDRITLSGSGLDEAARETLRAAALDAGVAEADIDLLLAVDEGGAEAITDDLNALFLERTIEFETGSDVLVADSLAQLDEAAELLADFDLSAVVITIEGHTDSDGSPARNQRLSESRAEAVRRALVERGVAEASLVAVGFGAEQPVAPNDTDENKARNRRVTFSVAQ